MIVVQVTYRLEIPTNSGMLDGALLDGVALDKGDGIACDQVIPHVQWLSGETRVVVKFNQIAPLQEVNRPGFLCMVALTTSGSMSFRCNIVSIMFELSLALG